MSLHHELFTRIPEPLKPILERAVKSGDFDEFSDYLTQIASTDPWMQPGIADEKDTKYYKSFAQTIRPKIVPAFKFALNNHCWPEIEVTLDELKAKSKELGLGDFGSPQDALYAFTADRYADWGATLQAAGLQSACMAGQGKMLVTVANRFLELDKPHIETEELEGAISKEFFESVKVLFRDGEKDDGISALLEMFNPDLLKKCGEKPSEAVVAEIEQFLENFLSRENHPNWQMRAAKRALAAVKKVLGFKSSDVRKRRCAEILTKAISEDVEKQEQIALKYMDEGKYLQKLFGGKRVEHIQSNVKMVANPIRGNKCEVDSIYRVSGEKRIILVEAKGRLRIARTQVYQIYETFRLRLPADWHVEVVALAKSTPRDEDLKKGFTTQIDIAWIGFDDLVFEKITESLLAIKSRKHFRWKIRKST